MKRILIYTLVFTAFNLLGCTAKNRFSVENYNSTSGESIFISQPKQLIFKGQRSGEGYFNKDGSKIIFQSERENKNPFYQIYTMDLKTGKTKRVSPGHGKATCSWIHPDGKRKLFSSTHLNPNTSNIENAEFAFRKSGEKKIYSWDYDENYEIFESSNGGRTLKNLTHSKGYDAEGSYSPDGNWIAFASNRRAFTAQLTPEEEVAFKKDPSLLMDLYLMRSDGSDIQRLTTTFGYDGGAFFSPDGKGIVWRRFTGEAAYAEIFTMDLSTRIEKQITKMEVTSWAPYYHPSMDYIIFTTNTQGFKNFELYVVDSGGKQKPMRITFADGFDGLPVFSPDGTRLLWTGSRTGDGKSQLFIADWNDLAARKALDLPTKWTLLPEVKREKLLSKFSNSANPIELKASLKYLASEKLEGRRTGQPGERLATEYAANKLKDFGFEPLGNKGSFYEHFHFVSGSALGAGNKMSLETQNIITSFELNKDWTPMGFSKVGEFNNSKMYFAGYGLVVPKKGQISEYDSYVHADVKNKWVVAFRGVPLGLSKETHAHYSSFASLRDKSRFARDRGASGIIFITPSKAKLPALSGSNLNLNSSFESLGIIFVSDKLAQVILKDTTKSIDEIEENLKNGTAILGQDLSSLKLNISIDIKQTKGIGRNVLGITFGSGQARQGAIIIGAHIDHLGRGFSAESLAKPQDKDGLHFGADDNASGVAAVLEIARIISSRIKSEKLKPKRDLIVAFWSGEELGLLGSSYFTKGLKNNSQNKFQAYINLDMVGRLKEKLIIEGLASSSAWGKLIEENGALHSLAILTHDDSYLPTDSTSFYSKGIPILSLFTGLHSEYHTPKDKEELINYDGLKNITEYTAELVSRMLENGNPIDLLKSPKPANMGAVNTQGIYFGTIPDYAQSGIDGVKLSAVASGGPADKGGIQGGDVIIQVGTQQIHNIYDYTASFNYLEVGKEVEVRVKRDGNEFTLKVTPSHRK
ncbi:MAG: M20/M25/M40 family metallo-hydrolase [bacterium]|nr:M20/M25/M40 family metallo-hydrolase [bacterium]